MRYVTSVRGARFKMELWNTKNLLSPPTCTFEIRTDEIDINHMKVVLQDGATFYNQQKLLKLELDLLSRLIYQLKRKFRSSKDFHLFEKVQKITSVFQELDISQKLEYLLSFLPRYDYHELIVSVPTKNMVQYVLVQLQGVGKVLCKAIESCKLAASIYERRLRLGHYWQLALLAIALVSRIHLICLNIVKYTCVLYARLRPFADKLKNVSKKNWLPEGYTFPKDLKIWLNVEWSKLEEAIEVADDDFDLSIIDLVGSSDDEVECLEISEVYDLVEDFKQIRNIRKQKKNLDECLTINSFDSDIIDNGVDKSVQEERNGIQMEKETSDSDCVVEEIKDEIASDYTKISKFEKNEDEDIGEVISEKKEDMDIGEVIFEKKEEMDIGEVISSGNEYEKPKPPSPLLTKINNKRCYDLVMLSSDEDDSVQFVTEALHSDFIPINTSSPAISVNKNKRNKYKRKKKENS